MDLEFMFFKRVENIMFTITNVLDDEKLKEAPVKA
jgi:hypothetical protein